MLNESKGTPSLIREIFNEIKEKLDEILLSNLDDQLKINIDKNININNKLINFKSNLVIKIKYHDINEYNGNINFMECFESDFSNCEIQLFIPKNPNGTRAYKSLLHELTHLYELYQVKDIFLSSTWIKSKKIVDFDRVKLNSFIGYFRHLYYISLPHEVRATLSSIEIYLVYISTNLMTKDINILKHNLEQTTEWGRYKEILNFDADSYYHKIINDFGIENSIRMFSIFNKVNNIKFKINTDDDLKIYFKGWEKYFQKVSKEMKKKIDRKISDIIIDDEVIDYYETHTDRIFTYDSFNKLNRNEKLEILLFPDINKILKKDD